MYKDSCTYVVNETIEVSECLQLVFRVSVPEALEGWWQGEADLQVRFHIVLGTALKYEGWIFVGRAGTCWEKETIWGF